MNGDEEVLLFIFLFAGFMFFVLLLAFAGVAIYETLDWIFRKR